MAKGLLNNKLDIGSAVTVESAEMLHNNGDIAVIVTDGHYVELEYEREGNK